MAINYVIKKADIDRATANGVSLRGGSGQVLAAGNTVALGSTIRAVADSGKKFTTTTSPTTTSIYFMCTSTYDGSVSYAPWIISADGKTASFVLVNDDRINYAGIYPNTVSDIPVDNPIPYVIKQADIDRATDNGVSLLDGSGQVLNVGDTVAIGSTIRAVAGSGKKFTTTTSPTTTSIYFMCQSTSDGSVSYAPWTLSADGKTASFVLADIDSINYTGIYSNSVSDQQDTTGYILTQTDIDNLTNNNATMKSNGVAVSAGMLINFGDTLVAYANAGWQFDKTSVYPFSSIYFQCQGTAGDIYYVGFNVADDGKTATLVLTEQPYTRYIKLLVTTSQKTEVVGNNNVYSITPAILTELNNKRFVIEGEPPQLVDYGQYILSVLQIPFALDSSLILEPENIQLANINIGVAAPVVNTDILTVDLGSINIVGENQNMLDYANTTAILYLPYCQPVNIDLQHVIDQTISIVYKVDCYTGIANVLISSTSINDVIINQNVDLGINIPMANNRTTKAVDNSNISVGGDNGIKTPFITIVRNESILKDGFFTIPVIDESNLSTASGYIRVEDVNLIGDTMLTEKESIISKLKSGVILK